MIEVEYPTHSGQVMSIKDDALLVAERLISLFRADETGNVPAMGDLNGFSHDPHFKGLLLFYEYFNGDTGSGLGAIHQTGWTGLVADLIEYVSQSTVKEAVVVAK